MSVQGKKILAGRLWKVIVGAVCIAVILFIGVIAVYKATMEEEAEIITQSTLEKIINVSELSTYEAVYNGVAKVMNDTKPENVDYYVSYEAKVKAGIDFEKVDIAVDNEAKVITVTIPKVEINDVNVDVASLDYIFMNDKANTATVSEQAYKECIKDVESESSTEDAIYELAEQNAENIIEALVRPFVEQLDEEYQLEFSKGGAADEESN